MRVVKLILAWAIAVAVTTALAVAMHSQFVMAGLRDLGAEIGFAESVHVTIHDIGGMGPTYGMFVAVALLLGFLLTALLWPRLRVPRPLGYAIGGAAAIAALLAIMGASLGITVVAGARTPAGFAAQCAVGALGGLVFAVLSRQAGRRPA
ncbi:MAG: hypothetical protein AB7O49_03090 [Sphingomonadales bacterium]